MSLINKLFGDSNARFLKGLEPIIQTINVSEKNIERFSDDALKERSGDLKKRVGNGENLDDVLEEAFALVREAAKRTLGQRHFDVQLMGGIALHQGKIAEMKTGEGKTLVATLPVYLNALISKGVHIVTVNDYLSRRDTVWMGQIYHFLGLTIGCLNHEQSFLYDPLHTNKNENQNLDKVRDMLGSFKVVHEFLRPCSRGEAYAADVTYGTNNEFGFDYLRDNMVYHESQIMQREHYYAVVDEIDSILIDEARTPLIISAPDEESGELYRTFSHVVPKLKEGRDFTIDEKIRAVSITEEGIEAVEKTLGIKDIYTEKGIKYVHHLEQALKAVAIFSRDKDYVVKNGEVIIVDQFTGRLMPGRRWSEGLHQAIEAKEGVVVQKESRTLASITFQNYFRMYKKISGMTGTALTSAEEFHKVYNLEVAVIPTNKPMIREDLSDFVFQTEKGKFQAIADEVKRSHQAGRPVLVGTVSIEKNEYLSALLKREGVPHRVLNAKNHEQEAEIIAQAGKKGAVTIATNMAGRGVDIMLGGILTSEGREKERDEVVKLGGLLVIGSERHEARRIDNQLRGRSGRQGDPGSTRFFVSMEDDLMRIFGSDRIKSMMGTFGIPEDQPIENSLISRAIESSQSKIEGMNFDSRKHILEYDDVMNYQRNKIYKARRDTLLSDNAAVEILLKEMLEKEKSDQVWFEKKRKELENDDLFFGAQRAILLRVIDMLWIDHLETMEYMRSSVGLRAYGQRDPLVEYKNEGARLFKNLESSIRSYYCQLANQATLEYKDQSRALGTTARKPNFPASEKVGRNDPCPCGSGKKYKRCHGS